MDLNLISYKFKREERYKSKEYNKNGHTSIRLKTVTNNQENDLYITSSEIKKLIKNSNLEELKNIFDNSKFYDNEFIKCLLFLYKNKTLVKNLNYEISKDKCRIILNYDKENNIYNKNNYIIENGNTNLLKYLVVHGVALRKIVYKNGEIPLFKACKSRNIDLVKYLIEHGANINKENEDGETPLFKAVESKNKELVEYLVVEHGAYMNKENEDGETPLFKAVENGEIPLFKAVESGNKDLAKYLIEHEAEINKENKDGETPLFRAIKKCLVKHGLDINKENYYNETPLYKVVECGNIDLVKFFVKHGADINKEIRNGETTIVNIFKQ
ncbi:ankyrin repeat-containing domain protein [Neocallimastix lanati (nom. inval.)]|nr:ankyrin repeat-containing domain protein [Neocallimastix sp. JGI-2020a]